ncbi:MAG: GNAT family N-acetyltransferase [bacterium]|nr:GNAT family N-acetyltransferase [bacterium]
MFISTKPYSKPLHDGFVLRTVSSIADIKQLANFNLAIHGDGVDTMTRELIMSHPNTQPEDWFFIEKDEKIIASLCLIPWTWQLDGVLLKVGEMGVVGTLSDYRGQGLVRELAKHHRDLLNQGGYHLSNIQGIPYFYRQFGYEYALPLEGGWRLELHAVPDDMPSGYTFRLATAQDIPTLMRLYDLAMCDLDIHAVRDEGIWGYLLGASTKTGNAGETWCVVDSHGNIVGYWRVERYGFGTGFNINECSNLSHDMAVAVLGQSKKMAIERNKPYIKIHIPQTHVLTQLARFYGGHDNGRYAWQIMIPDVPRLLTALKPAFEKRLASSPCANLTHTFILNLYRNAFSLVFQDGKLIEVNSLGYDEGESDMSIPPNAFTQLVLGHRNREELRAIFPDLSCDGMSAMMVDILFPNMKGFIYPLY